MRSDTFSDLFQREPFEKKVLLPEPSVLQNIGIYFYYNKVKVTYA
jgi:hypothetical protein